MDASKKIFDLERVRAIALGDEDFVKVLLGAYIEGLNESLKKMEIAIIDGDPKILATEAHKLKPTFGTLNNTEMEKVAFEIEVKAKNGESIDVLKPKFEELKNFIPVLVEHLEEELND